MPQQVEAGDEPSRWQQLFGKSHKAGGHDPPRHRGNQDDDDDDSRPTWVDNWEREKMLVQATLDPEDTDAKFSASAVTKEWEAGRSIAASHRDDDDGVVEGGAKKRIQAWLNVENTAQTIKSGLSHLSLLIHMCRGAVKAQAAIRNNTPLRPAPRSADPVPASDPARNMAARQALVLAKRLARAGTPSSSSIHKPRSFIRMQNPFNKPPKPPLPPAIDTLQHINARHAVVDKKRLERKLKASPPPPPPPTTTRRPIDSTLLRKQTHAVTLHLAQETERLAALETSRQQRHAAGVVLQDAFATWWSVVHMHQSTMAQAARAHMWHLQRRIWSAWRVYVRQIVHARAVAAAKAAAAWQHRADLDATVHYRKATLFKTFVQWNTFTKRSKAVKHAAAGFTKYKEAQLAREEAARVAAAQALADVQQQKAAAAALKLERKRYNNHFNPGVRDMSVIFNNDREMAREEAEKAQRRQLAVEQWTLAKRHHLRALVLTKAIKAKHWHHDTTLHQRFGAWVGYRDACLMLQWQAVREATLQRELSVRTASHSHLVRRLWGVVKSLTDARKAQLCRLQVKREADAKRLVLHVWSCRVGVWRKEAAAKREKDRMWRQVQVWLADDNN
ncbi:hypothetical protein DYB37_002153 [Aphanomyces astaci]|uniref:Sfi1 spindle body domain-containing protein n=1 Tax=Aphanomyces astaci TaxID=112090 RepID=A0A418FA57_APHAT|nr:hypothetical protein DYB37_002153 [Aphanomyces astaci]